LKAVKQSPREAIVAEFVRGQQVQVILAGSQRNGKTGVIRRIFTEGDGHLKYEVILDDKSFQPPLRKMICLGDWLELQIE